jgi:hypothetical protein
MFVGVEGCFDGCDECPSNGGSPQCKACLYITDFSLMWPETRRLFMLVIRHVWYMYGVPGGERHSNPRWLGRQLCLAIERECRQPHRTWLVVNKVTRVVRNVATYINPGACYECGAPTFEPDDKPGYINCTDRDCYWYDTID